jgi:hypothetical protein
LAEKIYNLQGNSEGFEVGVFTVRFGSVFINKSKQTEFFFLKKPKPVQTDRFQFGSVFRTKKAVWLGFFLFFRFWFGSV